MEKSRQSKCPKGTRRDKKTGECKPHSKSKDTKRRSRSKSSETMEPGGGGGGLIEASAVKKRGHDEIAEPRVSVSKKLKHAGECADRPTIAVVMERLHSIVGTKISLPRTPNKGLTGFLLEKYAGIPTSSDCLDCVDGEVKSFPVKINKKGDYVPKETIAITMLNRELLKANEWEDSRCAKKMERILYIPYYREGDHITIGNLLVVNSHDPAMTQVFQQIKDDYSLIRKLFNETETLTSSTGKYLQNRTKGPGHGSVSRAFYLRPEGIMELIKDKQWFTNKDSDSSSHVSK